MRSIRHELFIQIGLLMLLFIMLLFLANTFLLESMYLKDSQNQLSKLYDEVNQLDVDDYDSRNLYNLIVDNRTFIDLAIFDDENQVLYLPMNPIFGDSNEDAKPHDGPRPPIAQQDIEIVEQINKTNSIITYSEKNGINSFIAYEGILDNGFHINIRIPMASITENIVFLNQFILAAGLIILIISIFAANQIAKFFTKPILNMFKVTDHIKKLDFSKTCEITTNNELGQLAENINEMSYTLKDNITELAEGNRLLSEEVEERLKIDEQRKALLNNVSHELKTPLSIIQGYSEGLKVNLHKNQEKSDFYCDVIMDEAKKMDLIVSQLLDINHLQFGDFPLHKEKTDAYDFISYILQKYSTFFEDEQVDFSEDFSLFENQTEPLMINIDNLRSEQVLTNLISNALAYVNDQKTIKLSTSLVTAKDNTHLRITISNSHGEVSVAELAKWWNSFYKADKARTRENGGYGLGLSIIKAIQETDHNDYGVYYSDGFIHFYIDLDLVS